MLRLSYRQLQFIDVIDSLGSTSAATFYSSTLNGIAQSLSIEKVVRRTDHSDASQRSHLPEILFQANLTYPDNPFRLHAPLGRGLTVWLAWTLLERSLVALLYR